MKTRPDQAALSDALVLEISRIASAERDPGRGRGREVRTYVRIRKDRPAVSATLDWSDELRRELRSLFLLGETRVDVAPKTEIMAGRLRDFLGSLGWAEDGDVDEHLSELLARRGQAPPVPLTLRFGAPELFALPWELVRFAGSPIEIGKHPGLVLRREQLGTRTAQPVIDPPPEGGRILFAWSDAGGPVDWREHLEAISGALDPKSKDLAPPHEVLPSASLRGIAEVLKKRPAAVLHLLCHGVVESYHDRTLQKDVRGACLLLHDDAGEKALVTPHDLHEVMWELAPSLRLVVLTACESASQGDLESPFGSSGQQIHAAGVPAVVAMRYPLPIEDSLSFTRTLYEQLHQESRSLEQAFKIACEALGANPLSWSSPQLFARQADGPDHRPFVQRPYRGLKKFTRADAGWFFGRSREIERGVAQLDRLVDAWPSLPRDAGQLAPRDGETHEEASAPPRLLVVSGAPGSGMSSFVTAGLLPAWLGKRQDAQEEWEIVELLGDKPGEAEIAKVEAARRRTPRVLVWLDQMEGAFATGVRAEERDTFLRRLHALAAEASSRVTVVAAVRVDHLDRLADVRVGGEEQTLDEIARSTTHGLPLFRMRSDALREVIERPAARVGVALEEGLCDDLLRDVGAAPGAQPLLEYTLNLLWEKRRRRGESLVHELTRAAYAEIGGLAGALDRRADEVIDSMKEKVQRQAARRLLVRLVRVDVSGGTDRRCRVARSRLAQGPADEAAVFDMVLEKLRAADLVLVDEVPEEGGKWGQERDEVEIAHDQILRWWRRLRAWLDEDRAKKLDIQRIERWAEEGSTLDEARLATARTVLAEHGGELSDAARALVERSAAAQEAARLREKAAEQRMQAQLRRATSLSLIAAAREVFSKQDVATACLLLCEVPDPEVSVAAGGFERLAREVLDAGIPIVTMTGHEGPLTHVSIDATRRFIVTASEDRTVRVWSEVGEQLDRFEHEQAIVRLAIDHAGTRAATAHEGGGAAVWNAQTLEMITALPTSDHLTSLDFAFDDRSIAALDESGRLRVWKVSGELVAEVPDTGSTCVACAPDDQLVLGREDGEVRGMRPRSLSPWVVGRHEGRVRSVSVSPDGALVVSASDDGTARVFRLDGSAEGLVLRGHTAQVTSACFSPDGASVATASDDGTARLWKLDGSDPIVVLRHRGPVRKVAFSADGERVVTASEDGTARLWRRQASADPLVFRGHTETPTAVAFSADGRRIVTGALDRTAIVWGGEAGLRLEGHAAGVRAVAFSPDGRQVITGSDDWTARVWSATGPSTPRILFGHGGPVRAVAVSPDGRWFVTGCDDGVVRLWGAETAGLPALLSGHEGPVTSALFSADGRKIVTASEDGTVRVWLAGRPDVAPSVHPHPAPLAWVSLSADGTMLLARGNTGALWCWSAGEPAPTLVWKAGVRCIAFTPDGLVGLVGDGILRLRGALPQSMIALPPHPRPLVAAAVSPDLRQIATLSEDGALRVWAIHPALLQARLRESTRDCLPLFERQVWLGETEEEAAAKLSEQEARMGRGARHVPG